MIPFPILPGADRRALLRSSAIARALAQHEAPLPSTTPILSRWANQRVERLHRRALAMIERLYELRRSDSEGCELRRLLGSLIHAARTTGDPVKRDDNYALAAFLLIASGENAPDAELQLPAWALALLPVAPAAGGAA